MMSHIAHCQYEYDTSGWFLYEPIVFWQEAKDYGRDREVRLLGNICFYLGQSGR